jgi:hypothetical protein
MSTDTIYNWSTTADTNATADEEIEWSEYQAASTVNNSARAMMRRVAQLIRDLGPNATSTGTVNAYAVTSAATAGGAALNDGEIIEFIPHITNTSTSTLNKDSKGAVPLRPKSGTEFGAGQIIAGVPIKATYRQSSNEWIVTNPAAYVFAQLAPSYLASNTFGIKVGDVKLSVSATPDAGFVRLTETAQALSKTAYPDLNSWASAQGYPWGSASTTFNVPPAGGYFLRFAASGSSVDTSGARTPGSTQSDQNKAHTHTVSGTGTTSTDGAHTHTYSKYNDLTGQGSGSVVSWRNVTTDTTSSSGSHSHTVTVTGTAASDGGDEARVKNVAMHADMLAVPALVASGLIGVGGLAYKFSSVTTATDPGAGFFQLNNATPSSATAFYINETDANGASLASVIQAIPSGSQLYITKVGAPANYIAATVSSTATDNGAWDSFVLSACTAQGTISNGDTVSVVVMRSGIQGVAGPSGGGIPWAWDTATGAADPGTGKIRGNNATLSSITAFYVSATDANGASEATWLDAIDDSTSTLKGYLQLVKTSAAANSMLFQVTGVSGSGAYRTIAVTYVSGSATLSAGDSIALTSARTGDKGDGGGVVDHGELTGLGDDDHPQYLTDARGDARYPRISQMISWLGDTLAGIVPWRYVPPSTDPTAPKFDFSVTSGQWHNGPVGEPDYWDHTATLGFNYAGAARQDLTQSGFGITFESKFYQGTFAHEFHLQLQDKNGTSHRPLSFFMPVDGGAGSGGGFQSDTVYLQTYAGAERVTWSLAGSSPVMYLINNVQIWSNTNNNTVMRQLNAAGNAYLALPYYNNENRMIMENPMRSVAAIAPGQYTAVEAIITSASANDTLYNIAGPAVTGTLTSFQAQAGASDDLLHVFSNSGNGASTFIVRVKQNSTADPRVRFENNGIAYWTIGIDTSDANSFKIGGYTLTTDTKLRVDANAAGFAVPVKLPSYTVATVPSASAAGAGAQIYVSDESGGAVPAFSDGTSWRRVTDRVVVS